MSQKVPPLEESKAIILKAKNPKWLKEQEDKLFGPTGAYGTSIKDPAMRMWLIGKQAGLDVTEIKAATDGGEGTEITIVEMQDKVRKCKDKDLLNTEGWTLMNGGNIEQPNPQAKYQIQCCVLDTEEGTTSKNKAKLDLFITDGTGIAKLVAYAAAVDLLVEAKVGRGSIIHLPLVNAQYGMHNFSKEKDAVWWKFALPPFGKVNPLDRDILEFFKSLEDDVAKENQPAYLTGFITHVEEHEQEVCTGCNRWVLEKKPQDHDKCRDEGKFETEMRTFLNGTGTSVNGQTYKLSFKVKPKVKIAQDLVQIFGKVAKNGTIDVAFVRKAGATVTTEEPVTKPKVAVKAAPKKPAPAPEPEDEEQAEEEEAPAPPPKPTKKKVAPPPPPVEEEEETEEEVEEEEVEAPAPKPIVKVVKKAVKAPEPVQDDEPAEEEAEPVVVVKTAKKPVAKPAAKSSAAVQQEEVEEVPEEIEDFILKNLRQFGGKQRVFILTRTAQQAEVMPADGDFESLKADMARYCERLVQDGKVEWTGAVHNEVRLAK